MKKILMLLIGLNLIACNNNPAPVESDKPEATDRIANLKEEVINIHDTAMVKMPEARQLMGKLKTQWKQEVDSLPYQQAYRNLAQANDDMMDWMRSFEMPDEESVSDKELEEYLLLERRAIQAVNTNLDKAIEEGRFLLKGEEEMEMEDHGDHEGHQH